MDENIFMNNRDKNKFTAVNYDISNTVYNNINSDYLINFNDEKKNIIKNGFSFEMLLKLFDKENPKRNENAFIIIPMICDCFETVKFLTENKLLNDNDYSLLFMTNIVCFNESNNIELLNYIFDASENNKKFDITRIIFQLLKNDKVNAIKLLDWYYEHYKIGFANLLGNLIHTPYADFVFENLDNYDILDCDNYVLIQSMCIKYDLDTIKKYLDKVEDNVLPFEKFAKLSLKNNDENVFLYLNDHCPYICENFDEIIVSVMLKKNETVKILFKSYKGDIPEDKIINLCCDITDCDTIKFIIGNINTKINIHSKNDIILRTMIAYENEKVVEYLLDNFIFDYEILRPKVQRLIKFVNNNEMINLIKLKFNL